ncbi:KAP family P-loop NTPase fold protein [Achromobacter piechaudii]|uniref:KAP NTPase domain-containing protein n=1 Tax=Achromobacter piechaudii TaxID=72556 RepID=A0A6S7BUL1_9BURK|nr:P-loop NTPase fold protein [Achromobacter piechaudii]CAB3817520.1 hypothetical protein LMG1861_00075 [Achromobacter piechaudii]
MTGLWKWWARRAAKMSAKAMRAEQPDTGLGADAPIRNVAQDRLKRSDFADRLAGVLSERNLREGRVFAIRGGWGFGKSSLKNLIAERLDERQQGADWLDFNPWQWGDSDAIVRELFGQIADRLGGDQSKAARGRAEALRRYGAIVSGIAKPIKTAGENSQGISTVLTSASVIAVASAVGSDMPAVTTVAATLAGLAICMTVLGRLMVYLGRDRSGDPLDKVRGDLETRLRKLDRPLVVFVDDIDRLEPEQIRLLLRHVKANANLPNIAFVLLFQLNIVERALDPVADNDGRAFLEKIVQASFDLPVVPVAAVRRIFLEELAEVAGLYATEENGFSEIEWSTALVDCIQPRLRNLRDARRLISSVAAHLPLHGANDAFEVNILDFLVLETLRVFEPSLHGSLFRERGLLLQELGRRSQEQPKQDEAAEERLLENVPDERRAIAQMTIRHLFPPLANAVGGVITTRESRAPWSAGKRICSIRHFSRYFELQTADGEMSEQRFSAFLAATETQEGLAGSILELENEGLLPALAERLYEAAERLPTDNAAGLISTMFGIAEKLRDQHAGSQFRSPDFSMAMAVNAVLGRVPEAERRSLVLEALRSSKSLSVAATLINSNTKLKERFRSDFEPKLDHDSVEALKSEWLTLVRGRAAEGDGALIADPDLIFQLYRWRDYSGSLDEPRAWVARMIETDEGFMRIVVRMKQKILSHTSGDRFTTESSRFYRDAIEDFIGIDVAWARCQAIDPSQFPESEDALRGLRNSIAAWTGLGVRRDRHTTPDGGMSSADLN